MKFLKQKFYFRALITLNLIVLSSCASVRTIDIEGKYPAPLVNKIPLTLGVYYSDDFQNYNYIEINEKNGDDQYIVNTGLSQVSLFNTILPALFEEIVIIETIEEINQYPELDAVFLPTIEEFQLGLPAKTKLDLFEVWTKYNMRLTKPNGDYIADWLMTSYGKTPKDSARSINDGVNGAANIALRDLAASFTLGFNRVPEIREWLSQSELESEQI